MYHILTNIKKIGVINYQTTEHSAWGSSWAAAKTRCSRAQIVIFIQAFIFGLTVLLLLAARNVVARRRLAGRMIPVCTSALFILHLVIMVNVNV